MSPQEVINQYFSGFTQISLKKFEDGAVNLTYHLILEVNGEKKEYILQKIKNIFDVSIMEDIEFINNYLSSKKINTQKVIRTRNGEKFVKDDTSWWRVLSYIPGKIFSAIISSDQAMEAGRLVGNFHKALADCNYEFKFQLPHFHDTDFFLKKLELTLLKNKNTDKYIQLKNLAEDIITSYDKLPKEIELPKRIIHGDLKISNILFDDAGKAVALIDVDTFMHSTIAIELGDALRDWCLKGGEDVKEAHFDKDFYIAALKGYFSVASFLILSEKKSISYGVKLITLELAARFIIDAFEENYFNLNTLKYKNLFEQNKKRAENQFDFFREFSQSI